MGDKAYCIGYTKNMKYFKSLAIALFLSLSTNALAYYSLMDTADILGPREYTITGEGQWVTSGERGLNVRTHFDQAINDSSQLRYTLGSGVNALQAGFHYKWVPIPDYDEQPGVGFIFGTSYAKIPGDSVLAFTAKVVASKNYFLEAGVITPYGGLSTSLGVRSDDTVSPSQLTVGSRWKPESWNHSFIMGEISWDITDAFTYISVAYQHDFKESFFERFN